MHFTLPLNSPLLKSADDTTPSNTATAFNRFQTPPLQSAGGAPMNSPYSRMCDQLEHFVDAESEVADTLLFNRPRNLSVDLSPELEKASMITLSPPTNAQSTAAATSNTNSLTISESRSLWLGNVDPTVTEEEIRTAFAPFGAIENIRLLPVKECAFVNYFELESAIRGRNAMQGKPLGNMILRIGFGKIGDPVQARDSIQTPGSGLPSSVPSNHQSRSVWIGNVGPEITCDLLMLHFNAFGPIESCRVLEGKNCAFVNYYTAEAASIAKNKMNGTLIGDSVIKTGHARDSSCLSGVSGNIGSIAGIGGVGHVSAINAINPASFNSLISNEPIINLMKSSSVPQTFASVTTSLDEDSDSSVTSDGNQLREFRRIIESSPEEIPTVLKKLLSNWDFRELSIDSYGNILLQKMIERAQAKEQEEICSAMKGRLVEIAKHKNGTWVIQKLITSCTFSVQSETINELKEQTVELLEDQFGNYVIQCILTSLPGDDENVRFLVDKIVQNARRLATGKFSSRALKNILDSSNAERQKLFASALAKESVLLSVDPNGAGVIQWILDSELPGRVALVTSQLQGRLAQVALTKQGSVIVARIIGCTDEPKYRDEAILELYELAGLESDNETGNFDEEMRSNGFSFNKSSSNPSSHLDTLLTEPATCSILFKAFQVSKPAIRLRLARRLQPKLMRILMKITGETEAERIRTFTGEEAEEKIPVHLMRLYRELI